MSELHLDLCRQSTKHLHETIESLKENLRILEVFMTSGLSDDGKSSFALTNTEDSQDSGERHSPNKNETTEEKPKRINQFDRHKQCCCMCPARLGRVSCNSGYHRGGCFSPNISMIPRRSRPVSMPRLNRTASLRRDTAVERAARVNSTR